MYNHIAALITASILLIPTGLTRYEKELPPLPPVIYTPPEICQRIPDEDWDACVAPDRWTDMCFMVTSYWPFGKDGEAIPWNINADSSPNETADGFYIDGDSEWAEVALPFPLLRWSNRTGGRRVVLWDNLVIPIHDTFGEPIRQAGAYWHSGYQMKLIPVDIITSDLIHTPYCGGFR